jgi:hypothetical protein
MNTRYLLSCLLLLWSLVANAQMGFKTAPFGASEAEVQKIGKLFCLPDKGGLADRRCMFDNPAHRTFGGLYSDELWLNFVGGKLDSFTGQFRPAAFDQIRDALQQKYGLGDCVTSPASSCVWAVTGGEAVLMRRGLVLYLDVGSAAGKPERMKRLSQAQAKAKRDV